MPCNALKYKYSNTLCVKERKTYREVFHHALCHWPQQPSSKPGNDPWKHNPVAALNNTILWATLQSNSCNISLELAQDVNCWASFSLKDFRCVSTFWFFPTTLFNSLAAVCNFTLPCKIQSMFQRAEKDTEVTNYFWPALCQVFLKFLNHLDSLFFSTLLIRISFLFQIRLYKS